MGKTTNKLLAIAACSDAGQARQRHSQLTRAAHFHSREARQVVPLRAGRRHSNRCSDEHFQELDELVKGLAVLGELTPRSIDAISSATASGCRAHRDAGVPPVRHAGGARGFARRDRHGPPAHAGGAALSQKPTTRLRRDAFRRSPENGVVVMGGFIGATKEGVPPRWGVAAPTSPLRIVGAGIGAEEIQIWTDVDGMLTCRSHRSCRAATASRDLVCRSGRTGVFRRQGAAPGDRGAGGGEEHSRADPELAPAGGLGHPHRGRDGAPARIRSSRSPASAGITLMNIALHAHADGARISAPHLRGVRPLRDAGGHGGDLGGERLADHRQYAQPRCDRARTAGVRRGRRSKRDQAIVCLVGENIRYTRAWRGAFSTRSKASMSRMISQGASLLNLSFVVAEADLAPAVEQPARGVLYAARPGGVRQNGGVACLNLCEWQSSATGRWGG